LLEVLVFSVQALHFIQQREVQHLILHCLDLAISRTGHQVRVNCFHFFSDQALLNGFGAIGEGLLVAERDGTQTHKAVAGVAHVLDIFLEASGRASHAQLTSCGIDQDLGRISIPDPAILALQ
jgi:hypothetical protein